ncbi:LOW QUALITY PROTEIN: RNA pseudouridine synthase 7-like [Haliotis rubra]|uniref:LOW QUALITY PROTEIN: RNA pseudouridine synthase 7-like n=1 Tax=Haliotis rubra TaxID=36100 RepID=UPI001EE52AED|nr:LOW QUALITY PROTEIN: RNA pseudouridine synthase 7-like [Haliotis rubra]
MRLKGLFSLVKPHLPLTFGFTTKNSDLIFTKLYTVCRTGVQGTYSARGFTEELIKQDMDARDIDSTSRRNDHRHHHGRDKNKKYKFQDPNHSLEEYKATLSKRGLKKFERMEKWKNRDKKPKSKKLNAPEPGFAADLYEETEYYYENGLRKVYPYYYRSPRYVKQRWLGRTILDVIKSEFKAYSEEDYINAISSGNLTVNGKRVQGDYILRDSELIAHKVHRHENPVVGCAIEVIAENDDLIVINKPSSIPCHPCGKYRHNSVVFILGQQLGCSNLRNIYRLDRLTSGVLIMGKTSQKTKVLEDQVLKREVQKEYVCRVVGKFPDGKIECREPIGVISQKLGLFRVRPDGKLCHTTFERLSYNGTSSVVRCVPHTGRTHQIRVHLQFEGHPITNDPFYNSEAWGPNKNKGGVMERTDQEVSDRMLELHNIGHWTDGANPLYEERLKEIADAAKLEGETVDCIDTSKSGAEGAGCSGVDERQAVGEQGEEPPVKRPRTDESPCPYIPPFDRKKWIPDPSCSSCRLKYVDPRKEELVMYLHALKYAGPDWEYSTPLPDWAKEDWQDH